MPTIELPTRVPCGDSGAAACYDLDNTKKLLIMIAEVGDYVGQVQAACRSNSEGDTQ